jgi:hypothetical protein
VSEPSESGEPSESSDAVMHRASRTPQRLFFSFFSAISPLSNVVKRMLHVFDKNIEPLTVTLLSTWRQASQDAQVLLTLQKDVTYFAQET